jgi:endonuclease/exonuclease/phosphatase family metal-dependent hydrolase
MRDNEGRHKRRRAARGNVPVRGYRIWKTPAFLVLTLVAALAAAMLATIAGGVAAQAQAPPVEGVEVPARIFQFNMCGAVIDNDDCPSHGGSGEGTVVPALVSSILDTRDDAPRPGRPDIVTLNEVCETQFNALRASLSAAGYPMNGRFATAKANEGNCENDSNFGNAVLTRQPITNDADDQIAFPLPLPEDSGEVRTLLCVDTPLRGKAIKACSVHLSTDGDRRAEQVPAVAEIVNGFIDTGLPVLIGGDFNASPGDDVLDALYDHHGGTGRFREVDETDFAEASFFCRETFEDSCRSGEGTYPGFLGDRKIDYIFVSEDFASLDADATTSPVSDHDPLRGTAILTAGPPARVFQFNMCGVVDRCDSDGRPDAEAIAAIGRSVLDFRPDILTLNELCGRQFDALNQHFIDIGYPMHGVFDGDVEHDNCADGPATGPAGKALFSHEPVVGQPNVTQSMGCASTRLRGRTIQACVVHLPATGADDARAAARAAADAVNPFVLAGIPVIVSGDFNLEPDDSGLDAFYNHDGGFGLFNESDETDRAFCPEARDDFQESCRSGEVTFPTIVFPKKFDYVFVSRGGFVEPRGDATTTDVSDHVPLRGRASLLRAPGGGGGEPGPGPGDQPPTVDAGPPVGGDEGSAITLLGSATDPESTPSVSWSYAPVGGVDPGTSCSFADPNSARTTITCNDDGVFRATLSASDGVNPTVSDSTLVTVRNVPPRLSLTGPRPWQVFRVGTPVSLTASFTDPGANDTHTCSVAWDDGTEETYLPGSGDRCDRPHTFTRPGMFTIDAKVTDDDGGVGSGTVMVIVYDPDGGFETAGIQIESPLGALAGEPLTVGPAHSEFNVQYRPGESGPAPSGGKVSFRFDGHFDLDSTSLEWLVVTPDDKVATKGVATVAGRPGNYGFVLYAYDAEPDRYRLVAWPLAAGSNPDEAGRDALTYDNRRGASFDLDEADPQPITGGNLALHH